jgi:DNA-binding transcriptional regulator PaaX
VTSDQDPTETPATVESAGPGWLLLIYRVPPEPTRLRSTVWRRIKSLGAIYLQNSVAALPASPANERSLRKLRREIVDMSGTAILLAAGALAGEAEVRGAFVTARNEEYAEIIDKCEDFLRQVQKEYDAFRADRRPATERALETCEQSLEAYAARVYAEEAEGQ